MRREAVTAVIAILVVASLGIGYLSGSSARSTETTTSTSTSVNTSPLTSQETATSTTTLTSTIVAPFVAGAAATAVGSNVSNGIDVVLAVNATTLKLGQSLNVDISLFNARPTVDLVRVSSDWSWGTPGRFNSSGLPIIFGAVCAGDPYVRAVVLRGNYTQQELPSAANSTLNWQCSEGGSLHYVTLQPESSQANVTVIDSGDMTLPPHLMSINFTTNGYWDLVNFSELDNQPLICLQFCTNPPIATTFVPGVYTVAVSDEWGSEALIHVTVNG